MIIKNLIIAMIITGCGSVPGPTGRRGEDGKAGADGNSGKDGANGKDGAAGINGKDGVAGKDGIAGKDGQAGATVESFTGGTVGARAMLKIIGKYKPAVVNIECDNGRGTGFLVSDSRIMTADHIIRGQILGNCNFFTAGDVLLGTGAGAKQVSVYATGKTSSSEVAIIEFKKTSKTENPPFPSLLGYDGSARDGDELINLSFPLDLTDAVQTTYGRVVSLSADSDEDTGAVTFVADYAAASGSSGSPVFNASGSVIGIHIGGYQNGLELDVALFLPTNINSYLPTVAADGVAK